MSKFTDDIRKANPGKYDGVSDVELEAFAAKLSPEYQKIIEAERGVPLSGVPDRMITPPTAIPDPESIAPPEMRNRAVDLGKQAQEFNADVTDVVGYAIPAIAGTAGTIGGGMVAGPAGALVGGGTMGAGGEALRQWLRTASRGRTAEPLDTTSVAMEGAANALPGAGQVVSKLSGPLMRQAFAKAPQFLRANPNAPARMIEEGISVTPQGATKAGGIAAANREASVARGRGSSVRGRRGQFEAGPFVPHAGEAARGAEASAIDTGIMDVLGTKSATTWPQVAKDIALTGLTGGGGFGAAGPYGALAGLGYLGGKALWNSPGAVSKGAIAMSQFGKRGVQETLRYLAMLSQLGDDEEKK